MSFGTLFVIVLAGLAGPLLGAGRRLLVPVVVGELLAGLVLGRSGLGRLHADEPTTAFLGDIGFAMLMFTAGMHVPLRRPGLLARIRPGVEAALIVAGLAVGAGWLAARLGHVPHPAIYAVVLASGSAAILLPSLDELKLLADPVALTVAAQVAVADVAAVIVVPLALRPGDAARASLGIALIAIAAVSMLLVLRRLHGRPWVRRVRQMSKRRAWALDLRLSLLVLFGLCWIAVRTDASILVAGFAVGLVVASVGGPKRLSRQLVGIAQGFFVPLFFVVLGARIDVRALAHAHDLIELALLLVALNVVIHLVGALASRQPLAAGLAASAQLGVPAAVVSLGLQERVVSAGAGAAILVAALASVGISAGGVALIARRAAAPGAVAASPSLNG
jgi:Kef-type K+ transport system membrane component KefB